MGSLNPAAASSSGDWRHQLGPNARPRMRSSMLQTLRYLPVEEAWSQNIAEQIEKQSYSASANQSDYFKNIAAVIIRVEKQCQKYRHPDPGNNPAHSSASILMSQQQSQQTDNSTLVHASSLSSDDQSSTGDSQTSALHNMSGQSTIGQMHLMAIQSATQSGIRHNPLSTVQQPVNHQQQQHPEPSMNQQFSAQQIERTQQSLSQSVTGELSNLHPNQPNNLLSQHETQDCMQPQHQEYAASRSEDNLWENAQTSPSEFSGNEDINFWSHCPLLSPCSQPYIVPEILECEMNTGNSADIQPRQPWLGNFEFSEEGVTYSISEYFQDQEMNIGDEKDGCFDSTGLAAMEEPNSAFMTDRPTNLKKRKCVGSSSSASVLR